MRTLFIFSLLGGAAFGQPEGVSGPTSGYIFDGEARELRPIRGFVGAAHLGAALVGDADAASASSDGMMAAASRFGAIEVVRGFDSAVPVRVELAQAAGAVLFAWSGHDLAAVFTATRKVSVWRGVDRMATGTAPFDISAIDGDITGVLFDGERLALAVNGAVYLAKDGETRRILQVDEPSAMIRTGGDLFVADRGRGQVLRVRDYAGLATVETVADVAMPVGLQMTRRGLMVASAGARSVDLFDVATGTRIASEALDFVPTRMEALGSRPLALLNRGSVDEPLYVLDSSDTPRVYFVPAGRNR
ncbi:MAG: hypothetical protein ACKV2U_21900 [Bryobacteraceae bacterium]